MNHRYLVELPIQEKNELLHLTNKGKMAVRVMKRAQILLMSDHYQHTNKEISKALSLSDATVHRIKKLYVEQGFERALYDKGGRGAKRKLTSLQEAKLVSIACSQHPTGSAKWTLKMLSDELILLCDDLDSISHETIRKRLKEKALKPWLLKMWCIQKVTPSFIAQMEDIIDLYTSEADPSFPVICFDESLKMLVGEVKPPRLVLPELPAQQDYHYRRNGTAKIHMYIDAHRSWREVFITEKRSHLEFAQMMKKLVDDFYPKATKIRIVMDNLSTHTQASLYKAFSPQEARRILRKLEFHYTPVHASWLNMVEIELGVLTKQCLNRRIPDINTLKSEVAAWTKRRNQSGAKINWMFDLNKARKKMFRHYPTPSIKSTIST